VAVASSPTGPGRLSRVRGCLLLAVCGDALGPRFVGITRVDPADVDHQLATRTGSLRWTDDTAMTLVLAEHLVRRDGAVDEAELAGGFAADRHHDRCPVRCPCAVPLCGAPVRCRCGDRDVPDPCSVRLEAADRITALAQAVAGLPCPPGLADRPGAIRPGTLAGPGPDPRRPAGQQEASVVPWTATN
jgi:hypothetical protein